MRTGVFVLHYRFWPQVKETIDALLAQSRRPDSVMVVDNGSGDGSAAEIAAAYPAIEVVEIPVNRGPIAGMNVGVTAMLDRGVDAIMMATHELLLAPDAFERLAARLEEMPSLGAVGPLIGYLGDRETVFSAGGRLERRNWYPWHPEQGARMSEWIGRPPRPVEWVDGSCILLRAEAVRDAGQFYEAFHFLYDEADFLFRVRAKGWGVECVPTAVAWQDHGNLSPYIWVRNKLGLVARNGSKVELVREILRTLYHLIESVPDMGDACRRWEMRTYVRGMADFGRGRWGPPPAELEARWRALCQTALKKATVSNKGENSMSAQAAPTPYSQGFYEYQSDGSYRSAHTIVPILLELYKPESVVDVGCGIGTWLAAFVEYGVTDVVGVDGDYVPVADLRIPVDLFRPHDLRTPLDLGRRFDLAVCLEVAEHLPDASAPALVDSLTRLAPVVLFSAAAPEQGGVGHVNEQWPGYWIDLFEAKGYEAVDCIRPRVWDQPDVDFWYAQNSFLMVDTDTLATVPALREARDRYAVIPRSLVHPVAYRERTRYANDPGLHTPRTLLAGMGAAAKRSLRHRLAR